MRMQTNWLLVADEAVAHVFKWQGSGKRLEEVRSFTHPASHAREGELHDDAQGRNAQGRKAGHSRGVMSSVTSSANLDSVHAEAVQFARQLAQWLSKAQLDGEFKQLRVAAAPRFLGLLRQELSPQVSAVILDEVAKDLVHESREDLEKRFLGSGGNS
jgi:protein required for attachment to host cells